MSRSPWLSPALIIPMMLIVIVAAARGVCMALHVNPHDNSMMIATGVNVLAAEIALVPMLLTRSALQLAIVQAGLLATVVQMFVAVILSAIAMYAMPTGQPFVFWVIPLYWAALAMLVASLVVAVQKANSAIPPIQTKATNP